MSGKKVVFFILAVLVLILLLGNVLGPLAGPCFKTIRTLADSSAPNSWAGSSIGAYPGPTLYLPLVFKGHSLGESGEPQVKEAERGGETEKPRK
jgi:hypothetical protein